MVNLYLTRRGALGALAGIAVPSIAIAETDRLETLFDRQQMAYAADSAEWNRFSDIVECDAIRDAPEQRVQIGRILRGWHSEDGSQAFDLEYAYSEEDIRKRYESHDSWRVFGSGKLNPEAIARKERDQAAYYARMDAKIAELRARIAEVDEIKEACGYFEAERRARASSEIVKAVEREILDYVPATLDEAARKARWIVQMWKDSDRCYLRDDDETLEVALASIGMARSCAVDNSVENGESRT